MLFFTVFAILGKLCIFCTSYANAVGWQFTCTISIISVQTLSFLPFISPLLFMQYLQASYCTYQIFVYTKQEVLVFLCCNCIQKLIRYNLIRYIDFAIPKVYLWLSHHQICCKNHHIFFLYYFYFKDFVSTNVLYLLVIKCNI